MKPIYWILIVAAAIILIYGYNKNWFSKPKSLQTPPTTGGVTQTIPRPINTTPNFEPGKSYTDTATGGEIACYNLPPEGVQPLPSIFKADTTPPVAGNFYIKTDKAVCYLFPKA